MRHTTTTSNVKRLKRWGAEQRRKKNSSKSSSRNLKKKKDGNGILPKEKDDGNFLSFCLSGVNGQKKKVSKEGVPCNTTSNLNGHIFLVLLEKWILTLK